MWLCLALLATALAFVTLCSGTTSPLMHDAGIDSQIFQYTGWAMTRGAVPYTDLFDHKGLLLYALNALGTAISLDWGVLLLQGVSLALTLGLWLRALGAVVRKPWQRWAILAAMLVCLEPYYGHGGNCVEEWALPFISYPFAAYFRALGAGRRHLATPQLLLTGLGAGCCCLLRLNTAAPIVGLCLYLAIEAAGRREWRYLATSAALVAAGWGATILAAVLAMAAIGGWQGVSDMWFANVTFNLEYTSDLGTIWGLERVKFLYKAVLPVALLLIVARRHPRQTLPLMAAITVVVATTGERGFYHYLLTAMPLVALAFGCLPSPHAAAWPEC